MKPAIETNLPAVLMLEDMASLLGMSIRTLNDARKRRAWPFTQLPAIDSRPRWSRDQVLAVINGGAMVRRNART